MRRLFVSVRPPAGVLAVLRERIGPLSVDPPDGLRFLPARQWHVTLRFLGNAEEVLVDEALRSANLPSAEVEVSLQPEVMGHVVVLEAGGLDALAAAVATSTASLGDPLPQRAFRGHLTVARTGRDTSRAAVGEHLASLGGAVGVASTSWRPREVELVSSVTAGSGAVHEVMARYPLAESPGTNA